ncbi:hypothetical protein Tco_0313830 [Tanacetum coccineum]
MNESLTAELKRYKEMVKIFEEIQKFELTDREKYIDSQMRVTAPRMFKVDLQPLSPNIRNNRETHVDYLKVTQEHADTLRDIVEQARALQPLDNALDYASKSSTNASGSQPRRNTGNNIMEQSSLIRLCKATMKCQNHLPKFSCEKSTTERFHSKAESNFSKGCSYYVDIFKGSIVLMGRSCGNRLLHLKPILNSSRLVPNPVSSAPYTPPSKKDWDILFQPMFDECFQPPKSVVSPVLFIAAPIPADTTGTPSSTIIDQDALHQLLRK